jgi:hypothetical protein
MPQSPPDRPASGDVDRAMRAEEGAKAEVDDAGPAGGRAAVRVRGQRASQPPSTFRIAPWM